MLPAIMVLLFQPTDIIVLDFLPYPTFHVLPPSLQVFLEADLEVSEPEVFAPVSAAAEPEVSGPRVSELRVSEPEVVSVADVA